MRSIFLTIAMALAFLHPAQAQDYVHDWAMEASFGLTCAIQAGSAERIRKWAGYAVAMTAVMDDVYEGYVFGDTYTRALTLLGVEGADCRGFPKDPPVFP